MHGPVVGVDGCRAGWVAVRLGGDPARGPTVDVVASLEGLIGDVEAGRLAAMGIDIPIGLPDAGPRSCDVEARKLAGARRNSVFPAPLRGLLGARSHEEATARSRAICGKGLSIQAFGILAKVAAVDELMTAERQTRIVEVHPEVSFAVMAGRPMGHYKKRPTGRAERLDALEAALGAPGLAAISTPSGAAADDVVDALAAAWSARRYVSGQHLQLGGELDARGLRMEIIA